MWGQLNTIHNKRGSPLSKWILLNAHIPQSEHGRDFVTGREVWGWCDCKFLETNGICIWEANSSRALEFKRVNFSFGPWCLSQCLQAEPLWMRWLKMAPVLITVLRQPSGPPREDGGRLHGSRFTCQHTDKARFIWQKNIWSLSWEHRLHWKTLSFAFPTTVLIDLFGLGAWCMLWTGPLTYWDPGPMCLKCL